MLTRAPRQIYRTWALDSTRWGQYRPRAGDIILASYPKTGTTWMQQILSLLVFQTIEPRPIMEVSAWVDRRFGETIEALTTRIEAQDHRRFLKSHLPFDGLPIYDDVRYIHIARDGRDACISFHNHGVGFTPKVLEAFDRIGASDDAIQQPYPRIPLDPADHFHRWLTQGVVPGHADGSPTVSFFHFERTYWEERERPNVLLVHYNDLKTDLAGEMQRIAGFLEIVVEEEIWPRLIEAADFKTMSRNGATLMAGASAIMEGGAARFFHKGTNQRWRGVFRDEDLALYDAKVQAALTPSCAAWIAGGRLSA